MIFLGHHKSGSTALQNFMAQHAAELAASGTLYPFVDFEGAAYFAAGSARAEADTLLPLNIREPHNALAFSMLAQASGREVPAFHKDLPSLFQMRHAIDQQMRHLRPKTVVLVSEVFANFGAESPELVAELVEMFPAKSVTLYASFRPIDAYLVAWHGQRLRFGHKLNALREDAVATYSSTIHLDYRKILNGWENAFPNAEMILRPYGEVLENRGAVADFLSQTGLSVDKRRMQDRRYNRSLHPACHEIMRRALHELPAQSAAKLHRFLRNDCDLRRLPAPSSIEILGADQRVLLERAFAPVNAELGARLGRSTFFEDTQLSTLRPIPEADAIRAALGLICADLSWSDDPKIEAFIYALCGAYQ